MGREARKLGRRGVSSSIASGRGPLWGSVLLLSAALLLAGCPKKPEVQTGGPGAAGAPAVAKPGAPGERPKEGRDVFFDFDESVIRSDAKVTLDNNIGWLKANSELRVIVEGHCDERGTNEYNLALGQRRAQAVKEYLVAGGIDAERIKTISYGEERPFVLGHDESAWKWNRRGHFVVAN